MVHASVILSCAFPPKIMLDKPQITEKLTNAWHLLNIHYSDTSSEFQKAERMLNQHSYSQSEPRRHIAARLGADENGTLGPDLKNIQRLHARDLRVWGVGGGGWGCVYRKETFFKNGGICPFYTPSYLCESHLNGESLHPNSFITQKTEGHRGLSLSLPLSCPPLRDFLWGQRVAELRSPSRPKGSQADPQRAANHFQF